MRDFTAVLNELRAERNRLDSAIEAIEALIGSQRTSGRQGAQKRQLSAAGRARISAAARARWAAVRAGNGPKTAQRSTPKRRVMSAAAKAKIAKAARERWARIKAGK